MTNPTPLVVQRFMAELQGWTELRVFTDYKDDALEYPELLGGINPENGRREVVTNWPGSHDAARRLEVKDKSRFALCLFEIAFGEENSDDPTLMVTGEVGQLLFATPLQWRLAWILYKGYRWVPCANTDWEDGMYPHQEICPTCLGKGGKFVKVAAL